MSTYDVGDDNVHKEGVDRVFQASVKTLRDRIGITTDTIIPKLLAYSLTEIIWDKKYLNAEWSFYRRTLDELKFHFQNGLNQEGTKIGAGGDEHKDFPSDINDLLEYKPTEVVADKATQILFSLCIGELDTCYAEMETLNVMLEQQCVKLQYANYVGFKFLARTLECFANFVTGREDGFIFAEDRQCKDGEEAQNGTDMPDIDDLPYKSRLVVTVAKCLFARHVRHNVVERLDLLKAVASEDPSNFEWFITRAQAWRKKRRESSLAGGKRPICEEFDVVAEALLLAPENPYVQLSVLDCVIDCLRDYKGEFKCGSITCETAEETIKYMRATARKLIESFPNSVKIHSQISDYFCRFVPYRCFDIPFAEKCLVRAYELDPKNPKTTHRLGIFHRMSKGDIDTSYGWFKKTVQLDPTHFNATMECIKNKLARPKEENVIAYMEGLIAKPGFGLQNAISTWSEHEILEYLFYEGLAYFALNKPEKALDTWRVVVEKNDTLFRLNDLDRTSGFYNWNDKLISTDRLRVWVNEENNMIKNSKILAKNAEGGKAPLETNKSRREREDLIENLFSLMIGGGYPSRPCRNSGPFLPSSTYQLLMSKAAGDISRNK